MNVFDVMMAQATWGYLLSVHKTLEIQTSLTGYSGYRVNWSVGSSGKVILQKCLQCTSPSLNKVRLPSKECCVYFSHTGNLTWLEFIRVELRKLKTRGKKTLGCMSILSFSYVLFLVHDSRLSGSLLKLLILMWCHILSQLPREWSDPVAWQGCSSPGSYSIPVAPAGARNGRHGQLQSRWPQGAWLLVWRRDPEKEGDPHCEGNLCQDSSWVWFLFYAKRKWEPFFFYFNDVDWFPFYLFILLNFAVMQVTPLMTAGSCFWLKSIKLRSLVP